MKKIFLLVVVCLVSLASLAYDFEVDGIYYNVLDMTERTVEVTHSGNGQGFIKGDRPGHGSILSITYDSYSGEIELPSEVEYKGKKFKVVQIGEYAFIGQKNLHGISIPPSISNVVYCKGDYYSNPPLISPFMGCENLQKVKVGNANILDAFTSDDKWQDDNFIYKKAIFDNIKEITLLENFQGEMSSNFSVFGKLSTIFSISKNPPVFTKNSFTNHQQMDLFVFVPEESYEAYQNADVWKDFWELRAMKAVKEISFDKKKMELKPEETCQLQATVLPEDAYNKNVVWTSSNSEVAQVDASGTVIGKGKGDAVITATTTDGSNLSATCDVHVDYLVESIELNSKILILEPSSTSQLSVTILPEEAFVKDVVWQSLDETVASVDASGNVTANGIGKTQVVVSTTDGTELSDTCEVMVMNILVESIELNSKILILEPSSTSQLSVTILPEEAFVKDVVWQSLDETVASVDASGNVTANGIGKTQVVVSTTDGTELSDTCEVMVMNLSSIEIGGLYYKVGTDGAIVIPSPNGDKYDGNIEIPSNIVIPDFAAINVTTIASDAFANATSLRKIALPATISSIGVGAFASCSSLEFVGVENGSVLSANFDEVFADSKIKELYLGSDNVTFNDGSKLLSGLRSIVIGNSVTRLPDVAVCNNSLERFIVEDGGNSILEPSDYCKKSFSLIYQQTPKTNNVYYRFGYLVTIIHLNPLAELTNNKTIKDIYFGREVERVEIDMPTYETKPTSAGSRYQEFGYRDEYNYQYQEYIAKTDYKEMELTSIALNKDKVVMEIGETVQLYVVNNPSSVPTTNVVKWYSSDNSIATVDAFGLVTLMAKGEATITAETLDGTKLNASCQIMDIETGVNSIADGRCNDNNVYNLSGVRVMKMKSISDSKQLPQGVYIINGKKRFVKQ